MLVPEKEFNFSMGLYFDELVRSMDYLSSQEKSIFLGQAVAVPGTAMRNTLLNVPSNKLFELPVEEDFQLGLSIGLALDEYTPISIYPRWNFLLLATNQIVNHLDKLHELTGLETPPKVIIRTGIGSVKPLHPGPQHTGDFTEAFKSICSNLNVVRLDDASEIFPNYKYAYERQDGISTLLVEWSDKYNE
jgi:pyruvate/2-oxoglutarate/acetoin dehydrogenase E1 component